MNRYRILPIVLALFAAWALQSPLGSQVPWDGASKKQMEDALTVAKMIFEMDTVAWAATDQAQPVLQRWESRIQKSAEGGGYVQWREGRDWRILFFYKAKGGDYFPIADVLLSPPFSHRSRGVLKEYEMKGQPPLQGDGALFVKAQLLAVKHFEKVTELRAKPVFNQYTWREPDGTFRAYFIPGDQEEGKTRLGPDLDLTVDAAAERVVSSRQCHEGTVEILTDAASNELAGQERIPIRIQTPLPDVPDFLLLLLHPELAPLTMTSPRGRFRMTPSALPSFVPYLIQADPSKKEEPKGTEDGGAAAREGGKAP